MPEASAPDDALAEIYARGEERFHARDLDGAIEAFSDGLNQVETEGPPRLRAYFSVSLAIAHLDRWDAGGEPADLERAHALLERTVERDAEILRGEPRLEALARRNLERARDNRAPPTEPAAVNDPEPRTPSETPTSGDPPRSSVPSSTLDPAPTVAARRRSAAIGLLVSGTALVAGGIAVVIDGATLERRARAIAEDPPQGRQKAYIDDEVPRLAAIRYAIAGPALALGLGLLAGGGILLKRADRARRVVLHPAIGPRRANLTMHLRF